MKYITRRVTPAKADWSLCSLLLGTALCLLPTALTATGANAQQLLSLDSCRAMALRNNKQLSVAKIKQDIAANLRRSARTKYLPHVSAIGTYQHTSKEISILNDEQKYSLSHLGTNSANAITGELTSATTTLGSILSSMNIPAEAIEQITGALGQKMSTGITNTTGLLDTEGQKIVDAFRTDTRNIWAGQVLLVQPLFMGGSIIAANRLADLNQQLTSNQTDASRQLIIYGTDKAYWQIVSLKHKKKLAESYRELIKKLDSDVQKMIAEGVATRSEGLSVSVKLSEAEMAVQKVDDALTLCKMLLCQMIGLPMDGNIILADENADDLPVTATEQAVSIGLAVNNRPEVRMLENAVDMSRQTTNILKAANLPQLALMGGYAVSNPNVLNGFEKKFGGFWNVGLLLRIPIWNWGDVAYKVRAAKGATAIATLELEEAREKIELQINQSTFKVGEADKRLAMAQASVERADENLRTATLGFTEGVITPTVVMEAQTAWLQAQSQRIDAQIDVRLSQVDLLKATGNLKVAY